jgi:HEAT repeat protein
MPLANVLLQRITSDLSSAKDAETVAEEVLHHHERLPLLVEGLDDPDDIVRAKTAHAMERIADVQPALLGGYIPTLTRTARADPADMVRWHMAMILGEIPVERRDWDRVIGTLEALLAGDESLFVKSWAIVSLTNIGVRVPSRKPGIVDAIWPYREHESSIVQAKARRAIEVLETE